MDFENWRTSNAELLQHMSTLMWIKTGNSDLAEKVSVARIGMEVYQRLSGQREVEQLRNQTIAAIAQYVSAHPNASKEELQKVLAKYIFDFAQKVDQV